MVNRVPGWLAAIDRWLLHTLTSTDVFLLCMYSSTPTYTQNHECLTSHARTYHTATHTHTHTTHTRTHTHTHTHTHTRTYTHTHTHTHTHKHTHTHTHTHTQTHTQLFSKSHQHAVMVGEDHSHLCQEELNNEVHRWVHHWYRHNSAYPLDEVQALHVCITNGGRKGRAVGRKSMK